MPRYIPMGQREPHDEQQPIRYQRPSPRVVEARPAHQPQQRSRPAPEDQDYDDDPRATRKLPVVHPAGVRVVNVETLFKGALWYAIQFAIVVLIVVCFQKWKGNVDAGNYTYSNYRAAIHATNAPCKLDGSLKGVTTKGMVILCPESGKTPSADQTNQWQGYILWDACYEFGDGNACAQLND